MEEMKKYMGRTRKDRAVVALAGMVFGVLGAVQLIQQAMIVGTILLAVCVLLVTSAALAGKQDARYMQALADRGELEAAAADFQTAEELPEAKLKVGQHYVFRKGWMEVLKLSDLRDVYTKRESDDNGENSRGGEHLVLFVGLADGRSVRLCSLYDAQQDDLRRDVVAVLRQRVPDLEIN